MIGHALRDLELRVTSFGARWLPTTLVNLRNGVFTRVNGEETIPVPQDGFTLKNVVSLYDNPNSRGRARGARLSNLFWYWQSPGAEVHQENLEDGPVYGAVRWSTAERLARHQEALPSRIEAHLDALPPPPSSGELRLTSWFIDAFTGLLYETVFEEPPSPAIENLVRANAEDFLRALKGLKLRDMPLRRRLTEHLVERMATAPEGFLAPASEHLSRLQLAQYIQGVFFNTGIIQVAEAMAHIILCLAEHTEEQEKLASRLNDEPLLEAMLRESLRLYPLFGIAHRITSGPIELEGGRRIPAGSVLCFNYKEIHQLGYEDPECFRPERWLTSSDQQTYPFGFKKNRACPAERYSVTLIKVATRWALRRYRFRTAAHHTRSMPNFGPCLVARREEQFTRLEERLAEQRLRDQREAIARSVRQFFCMSWMTMEARRQRLMERFFERGGFGNPHA